MSMFDNLTIGFEDKGFNTADSFVDREKELPTKNVSIYDIDFNPLNDATDSEEDKIVHAEKIHEQGMVYAPLHVYLNKSHRHGSEKKYMLLGGHFRLDALLRNAKTYSNAQKNVPVIILPEPTDEVDEIEKILLLNESRALSDEDYKRKVELYLKVWNGLVEKGKKPQGIQKRKWIANRLGNRIGEHKVEGYIHDIEGYTRKPKEPTVEQLVTEANLNEVEVEDTLPSSEKEHRKMVIKNMSECLGRKVQLKNGFICIQYQDKEKGMDDFDSVVNCLNFDENGELM